MARTIAAVVLVVLLVFSAGDRPFAHQDPLFETTLVGVVVPDEVQPGDSIMGTVTLDPAKYEGVPGLRVITAEIPAPSNTLSGNIVEIASPSSDPQQSGQLSGMIVDIPKDKDEQKKRGNIGRILLKAAQVGSSQLPLLFRRQGGQPIATRSIPVQAAGNAAPLETFEMPSVIGSNDIPAISGPVGANPQVAIGDVPADVVASGPRSAVFEVPPNVSSGAQAVTLQDSPAAHMTENPATTPGGRSVVFDDVTVVGVGLKADGPTKAVARGTETPIEASITGTIAPALLDRPLPINSRYLTRIPYRAMKGAPKPGDRGRIGILIENRSPGIVKLEGEQNGAIVKWFDRGDIERGRTSVKSKIIARRVGAYNVRARVMPMVPPAIGKITPKTGTQTR